MKPVRMLPAQVVRRALFVAFTLSGFAGLIYESIWSHYLKLLLGHAAYAQTLVLVLFMGGMAIGSWLCARVSSRIRHPLIAYAAVELALGIFGFSFDRIFRAVSDFVLFTAAPSLGAPLPIEMLKWSAAGLLILPACVMLGATFPLISAGVVRLSREQAGNALGWLYFTNSFGAVVGVLTSGFVLISWIGLPGTLLTAGLCNFALAFLVYAMGRRTPAVEAGPVATAMAASPASVAPETTRLLLAASFLTGAASFFYEIGWIRMLSLVLGSATHSFELMLGAFILGLALGALWVRNRIDGIAEPMRLLAWVQVAMGTAALCTLVVYSWSFDWMGAMVRTLARTDTGFLWFNVMSQGICMVMMLPVTVFAGMTLPIITALVLRSSADESAIGRVYSANTWGAILGVIVAVHLVMPYLGLRNVVVAGALIDVGLGLWLFSRAGGRISVPGRVALAACLAVGVGIVAFVRFDSSRLSSGVYRHGFVTRVAPSIFHRDGRTASIDVSRKEYMSTIVTNGKPDAALRTDQASEDDYTMILTGVLPLALKPDTADIAVIGMGSGRSTHVFLGSPDVKNVDTIEIEPAMVEGAKLFGPLVERAFTDPRSHIHIEDAKTFFARHQKKYDVIMSEPSNPWVSGVASLFSREFYHQVKNYIAPGGVFVQWLQLYEFDDSLVASVLAALDGEFDDYVLYAADDADILIAAVPTGTMPKPDARVLEWPGLGSLAALIGVKNQADLQIRWIGDRSLVRPWIESNGVPVNSDYFPYLDQHAAKFRFLQKVANGIEIGHPVSHRLSDEHIAYSQVTPAPLVHASGRASNAASFAAYFEWRYGGPGAPDPGHANTVSIEQGIGMGRVIETCQPVEVQAVWVPDVQAIAGALWPYLEPEHAHKVTALLRKNVCQGPVKDVVERWIDFLDAITDRDWESVSKIGGSLVASAKAQQMKPSAFLVRELLLADFRRLGAPGVQVRISLLGNEVPNDPSIKFLRAISGGGEESIRSDTENDTVRPHVTTAVSP